MERLQMETTLAVLGQRRRYLGEVMHTRIRYTYTVPLAVVALLAFGAYIGSIVLPEATTPTDQSPSTNSAIVALDKLPLTSVVVTKRQIDIGDVAVGTSGTVDFVVENAGPVPARIIAGGMG